MGKYRLPSHRRRAAQEQEGINLVPMVDSIFNVLFFLLMTTTFISIYEIKSPIPLVSSEKIDEKIEKDKLNLLLEINTTELVLRNALEDKIFKRFARDITNPTLALNELHQFLFALKKDHPKEDMIIINPDSTIDYNFIVQVMDAVRELSKDDVLGGETSSKKTLLFSNIIFGNLSE